MATPWKIYRGSGLKGAPRGAKVRSSVSSVQIQPNAIIIVFREHSGTGDAKVYVYSYRSAGESMVTAMIALARRGAGLNRFINANKPDYDRETDLYGIYDASTVNDIQYQGDALMSGDSVSSYSWMHYFGTD